MSNPFLKRATEHFKDDTAFLSVVTPEPFLTYFKRHSDGGALFDKPVRVLGSPGSGKTTMATLLEFKLTEQVLRGQELQTNKDLAAALHDCGFAVDGLPVAVGIRLPMESEYRDFWELPYDEATRTRLVLSLIQARALLGLFRNLMASGTRRPADLKFLMKPDAEAAAEMIGSGDPDSLRAKAREVERAIYAIGASLIPPELDEIGEIARLPYRPFDVITDIEMEWEPGRTVVLKPLVILDDAHTLHERQFEPIFRDLARREMRVGRWIMMRLDTLDPHSIFRAPGAESFPGLKVGRDYVEVFMQTPGDRDGERKSFRRMATDMADRYLRHHRLLHDRGFDRLADLLPDNPPGLSAGQLAELKRTVNADQNRLKIPASRTASIEASVDEYVESARSTDLRDDVKLGMIRILLHRYANRIPQQTLNIFETSDQEPSTPLRPNAGVAEGARVHLRALYGRAYHFGINDLCDASDENAELFLHLAGSLAARMETLAIKRATPVLLAQAQQDELVRTASQLIANWNFPFARKVTQLIERIAGECVDETIKPNARLGAGANAVGVIQSEIDRLLQSGAELATILKYAVAYGALKQPVINYGQGGKLWCLLELSGPVCLKYSLTLKRGGFLERRVADLSRFINAA
jgi:hypothetical protein